MKRARIWLASIGVSLLATAAMAQTATGQNGTEGQAGNTVHRLRPFGPTAFTSMGFGFGPAGTLILAKAQAPFSAEVSEQAEQVLNDGTTIRRENQETVMRDSAGRIYRARTLSRRPRADTDSFQMITIIDSVQQVQYVCSPLRKVCTKMAYRTPPNFHRTGGNSPQRPDVSVEELGSSEISGIEVEGQRVTRTIPEGRLGNDRPITSTEESWYSKALGVNVQIKRTDPRMGVRTTTLTSVNPEEPAAKYFQIPEGYRVEERKLPNGAIAAAGGSGMVKLPKAQ